VTAPRLGRTRAAMRRAIGLAPGDLPGP
jgi:hypothetical protein